MPSLYCLGEKGKFVFGGFSVAFFVAAVFLGRKEGDALVIKRKNEYATDMLAVFNQYFSEIFSQQRSIPCASNASVAYFSANTSIVFRDNRSCAPVATTAFQVPGCNISLTVGNDFSQGLGDPKIYVKYYSQIVGVVFGLMLMLAVGIFFKREFKEISTALKVMAFVSPALIYPIYQTIAIHHTISNLSHDCLPDLCEKAFAYVMQGNETLHGIPLDQWVPPINEAGMSTTDLYVMGVFAPFLMIFSLFAAYLSYASSQIDFDVDCSVNRAPGELGLRLLESSAAGSHPSSSNSQRRESTFGGSL